MKILFICCAGMSSSLVVKKLEDHITTLNSSNEEYLDLSIEAVPLDKFRSFKDDYDLILLAPQIGYKLKEFKNFSLNKEKKIPVEIVNGLNYGLLRVDKILEDSLNLINAAKSSL